jgi:hypothetical protein
MPTIESSKTTPKLRANDPDLPLLAAQAALELENFKTYGQSDFNAVKQLSFRLKNSFGTGATKKALLESNTVSVVGRALNSSAWSGQISTMDELNGQLWEIADKIEKLETDPGNQPIDKIRDFCVALSECAASYRQTLHEARPPHPFRR